MDQNEKVGYASSNNGISTTPANIPSHSLHVGAPTIPVSAGTRGGGFMRQDWRSNRKSLLKNIDCFGLELAMQEQGECHKSDSRSRPSPPAVSLARKVYNIYLYIYISDIYRLTYAHTYIYIYTYISCTPYII